MTRAFDFVVGGTVSVIAVIIHRVSIELFAPGQPLYDIATSSSNLQATARATLWFEILTVWAPLLVFATIWLWVLIREFRRQIATASTPTPR